MAAGATIKYGPYKDVQPFSQPPLRLHFTNNNPFAEAEVLDREVEVSHWGNVAVEERYSIRHVGAKQRVRPCLLRACQRALTSGLDVGDAECEG